MAIPVTAPAHMRQEKKTAFPQKQKGWSTPYGFLDFTHPVTYEEACKQGEQLAEFAKKLWDKHNGESE